MHHKCSVIIADDCPAKIDELKISFDREYLVKLFMLRLNRYVDSLYQ